MIETVLRVSAPGSASGDAHAPQKVNLSGFSAPQEGQIFTRRRLRDPGAVGPLAWTD